MSRSRAYVAGAALFAMTAFPGCMSTRPPQELVDARAAYARAYVGPAAQANVYGLHDAWRALDEAEKKFAVEPSSEEARHLAYLAHRRVLVAETNARATIAANQRARAEETIAAAARRPRPKLDERSPADDQQKARTSR